MPRQLVSISGKKTQKNQNKLLNKNIFFLVKGVL